MCIITPGFIEELDNERKLMKDKYPDFGVMDQEHNEVKEMCDSYEGL